jgi:moderate conductance mechanosensitive channel
VRLALEENHLLPGDPNRVFSAFSENKAAQPAHQEEEHASAPDPTTLKPQDVNPFKSD